MLQAGGWARGRCGEGSVWCARVCVHMCKYALVGNLEGGVGHSFRGGRGKEVGQTSLVLPMLASGLLGRE